MTATRTLAPYAARLAALAVLLLAAVAAVRPVGSQPNLYPPNATFLNVAPLEARAASLPTVAPPTAQPAPTQAPQPTAVPAVLVVQSIHAPAAPIVVQQDTAAPEDVVTLPNGAEMTPSQYAALNDPAQNGGSSAGAGCTFPIINGRCGNGADIRGTADSAPAVLKTDVEGERSMARPSAPEGQTR